jgi:prepilin-type N-terminal cleavage/methylation domain-containing protein
MNEEQHNQRGLTLIELLISIAIVGILATGIFSFISFVYQNQIKSYQLAQRTEQALIMKAALDNSVTNAGSIAAPTLSSGGGYTNGSTPFNIFGAIGNFLYGNCPAQGLFGNIYGFLNTTTNTIFNDCFLVDTTPSILQQQMETRTSSQYPFQQLRSQPQVLHYPSIG